MVGRMASWEGQRQRQTWENYQSYLKNHVNPFFGSYKLTDIRHAHVQRLIVHLCGKNKLKGKGQKLSANTIGKVITMLKTIFKAAVKNNLIRLTQHERRNCQRSTRRKYSHPTKEQIRAILDKASSEARVMFLVDAMTGLRRGELLALRWSDMDWLNQEVLVDRAIVKCKASDGADKYKYVVGTTKSGKSRRVGLAPIVIQSLRVLYQMANPPSDEAFNFTRNGTFIDPEYFSKWITLPLVKGAGIGRFHDLRHFFASMLIQQGESAKYVQDQVGHASITSTFDTYGHLMPQAKREATAKLEQAVFGEEKANVRTLLEHLPEEVQSKRPN